MKVEKASEILNRLEGDRSIQNFIAQGNSRYILLNVNEPRENFPGFTSNIEERLTSIAFSYLSCGCSMAENDNLSNAVPAFEKGASILEYIHYPLNNRREESTFFLLASALAHYAAFQYSKAFIILKEIEYNQIASSLIASFLRKDFSSLQEILNSVLLSDEYTDENINELEDEQTANYKVATYFIAKALACVLEYFFSGEDRLLERSKAILQDILEVAAYDDSPALWWMIRLLRIITRGLDLASVWNTVPPHLGGINDEILCRYITGLSFAKPNIVELFTSQRLALEKTLGQRGAVVGLPTSSGKTRIAEIAILQELMLSDNSMVLYLAPFRSLAFEVEESLSKSFSLLGFHVSHLYGGSQFNKIDQTLIDDSRIIVATPEKAKAIIRADGSIADRIRLVIVDEGHLLGASKRNVINELFIEELKIHVSNNGGKLLLLSAVLPNTREISQWITSSNEGVVESNWRPSSQRLGRMEWTGNNVNIFWESEGEPAPFNNDFIEPFLPGRRRITFPKNKREAVAVTAVKLMELGSVLIFVGRANMINGQAKDVLTALTHLGHGLLEWSNSDDWERFQLACNEAFGDDSLIKKFASYGIICHDGGLPADVRSSMEKLMRNGTPRIIVSTTTLGQGVNIGVSSVIIANVYISTEPISNTDFWNIAGRAGRAFVDSEGKILYAIDGTQAAHMVRYNRSLAAGYFDKGQMNTAQSGVLMLLEAVIQLAHKCNIDEELLLELISENKYDAFIDMESGEDYSGKIQNDLDQLDDTLLALNVLYESQDLADVSDWIDDCFRNSLSYIQATAKEDLDEEKVISFFKARNKGVVKMAGEPANWPSYVSTSIPLRSSLIIEDKLEEILEIGNDYSLSERSIQDLITFHQRAERISRDFPSDQFNAIYGEEELDTIRNLWLRGESMNDIMAMNTQGLKICTSYFGFTVPWALNAIARKLNDLDYFDESEVYSDLAALSELGLPDLKASRVYLAGVRSRVAATELSIKLNFDIDVPLRKINRFLIDNVDDLKIVCSDLTVRWLDLINRSEQLNKPIEVITQSINFTDEDLPIFDSLFIKKLDDKYYVCNSDYSFKRLISIESDEVKRLANNLGVYFEYDPESDNWHMEVRDPHLKILGDIDDFM